MPTTRRDGARPPLALVGFKVNRHPLPTSWLLPPSAPPGLYATPLHSLPAPSSHAITMPATRTITRTGSRQPTPRLHHPAHAHAHPAQAGPSNPAAHPIVLEDDEGPARTRRSVERKASKPRSQQKARAPPSSQPSEVIEISSDEDDAPLVKKKRESKADASRLLKAAQEVRGLRTIGG